MHLVATLAEDKQSSSPPDLPELRVTDAALARAFAEAIANTQRFDFRRKTWRIYEAPVWRLDTNGEAIRQLQAYLERRVVEGLTLESTRADRDRVIKLASRQLAARQMKHVLDLAGTQAALALHGDEFDRDPMLLACRNAVIDLRTGEPRAGRPHDLLSLQAGAAYDAGATCPRFLQFLEEVFEGNRELAAFIQRWTGYCLTGSTQEQVFVGFHGETGNNGKTKLAETLGALVGDYGLTLPFATFTMAQAHGAGATPDLAALPGRRLVWASETRETARFDEGKLKMLTGEDRIAARHLYGQYFEFVSVAKLLFLFNHQPVVTDSSPAFWRRALLVPFRRKFTEAEIDKSLGEKLIGELPGILNWAIAGCLDWQRVGLCPPSDVRSAVDQWREDNDVAAKFLAHACDPAPGEFVATVTLYAAFESWCERERIDERDRLKRKAFSRRLKTKLEKVERSNGDGFVGMRPRG